LGKLVLRIGFVQEACRDVYFFQGIIAEYVFSFDVDEEKVAFSMDWA